MIEPDIDWYGPYARRSALADYLELLAMSRLSFAREGLADVIRDAGWTHRLGELFTDDRTPEPEDARLRDELDDALLRVDSVESVLRERASLLGDRYPFVSSQNGRLELKPNVDPLANPYVALLALTVSHATGVSNGAPAFAVFEATVTDLLERRGWPTANLGGEARLGSNFDAVLASCCAAVGLSAYPEAAIRRRFAQDEGSDSITNLWPGDGRPGGLQLVGQVTCAKSDEWDKKIQEPPDSSWKLWLGKSRKPDVFLAVPHHVEENHLAYLVQRRDRDVLDRLRIASFKDSVLDAERRLTAALLAAGVVAV